MFDEKFFDYNFHCLVPVDVVPLCEDKEDHVMIMIKSNDSVLVSLAPSSSGLGGTLCVTRSDPFSVT